MPRRITVTQSNNDGRLNYIYYDEDGVEGAHCHVFPDDALTWRCAEYDYDPENVEILVETILAERWEESFDPTEIVSMARAQRSQAKRTRISRVGLTVVKNSAWQSAISKVKKPSAARLEAMRFLVDNVKNKAPEISELAHKLAKGSLTPENSRRLMRSALQTPQEREAMVRASEEGRQVEET